MKFYVIAGEASGDLHGSNLMKAMKTIDPKTEFRFWGGDKMAETGGEPVKHIKDLAFMGFIEVIANLRTITQNIKFCKKDVEAYQPDALILIDYPGFNLRIAEFAKERGIKVLYYISPQVWAWKEGRVKKIRRIVDKMYCILPFEKDFYKNHDFDVEYVGHPLIDAIENFKENAISKTDFLNENGIDSKPLLALLPGSRRQEIKIKLPIMLEAAKQFKGYNCIVCGAPNLPESFYNELAKGFELKVLTNRTYDVLNYADMAMVTSGTATLETGLFQVPQVVCYKGSNISYQIAKRLIKVKFISLVNLILDKEVVKELIQKDLTPHNIRVELMKFETIEGKEKIKKEYQNLISKLGGGGASHKAAKLMLEEVQHD